VKKNAGTFVLISTICAGFSVAGGAVYGYFCPQRKYEQLMQFNYADRYLKPPPVTGELGPQGWWKWQEDYEKVKARERDTSGP
jgi:hypothetical protein